MAPLTEPASQRWSDEEHDLLVQMTNDQIELEAEDASKMISWAEHWKQVPLRLQEHGYNRTPNACRGYWKRVIESQKAKEQAAGPRWDDSEHQILVGVTEEQLKLEKADPSSIIPWPQHWKKVTLYLQENGYTRSADSCAAYWMLVQNNSAHAAGSGSGIDSEGLTWEANGIDNDDYPPLALGDTSTQRSVKFKPWTNEEYENLLGHLRARRELEENNRVEKLSGLKLWTIISQLHQQSGFDRTWEACKTYWQNNGRSRSGFDERRRSYSKGGTESRLSKSKSSSISSSWSPVNELEDSIVVLGNTATENPTPRNFPNRPQPGAEALQNQTSSLDPNLLLATSMNRLASDCETRECDSTQAQGEQEKSTKPRTPTQPLDFSETKSSQPKDKTFRFKPHQKAFLEAEAATNGFCPDVERREQLALVLGVEEKSVRNWFTNSRRGFSKSQGSPAIRCTSMSTSNFLDDSHSSKRPLIHAGTERSQGLVNSSSIDFYSEDGTPNHIQPFKRVRLGDILDQDTLHNIHPTTGLKLQAPPRDPPEVPSNGLQISQQQAFLTGDHLLGNITSQMSRSPNASSNPALQVIEGSRFGSISRNSRDIESPLAEQPSSTPKPSTPVEHWQTIASTTNQSETAALATSSPKPVRETGSPQITSKIDSQSGEKSSATPQPAKMPLATQSTSTITEEEPKEWLSRKVQSFKAEIQTLNRDTATRIMKITSIEQEIEDFKNEDDKYRQNKEKEIARVLREIDERYNREHDALKVKMEAHNKAKQSELDGLNRNSLEVARKETGLKRFQAIIEYYEADGDGY